MTTTRRVLGEVLDTLLRLLHPFVPFVTEALWTVLTGRESLVVSDWPQADPARFDPPAEAAVMAVQGVVTEVRRFRSEQGVVKPSQRVPARITGGAGLDEAAVRALLRLDEPGDGFAATASLTTAAGVRVEFDLSGTIDVAAERARLGKVLAAAEKERAVNAAKLGNGSSPARRPTPWWPRCATGSPPPRPTSPGITAALDSLPPEDAMTEKERYAALLRQVEAEITSRWGEGRMHPTRERIEALLDLLGQPQRTYRSIHLTGTNGKTSTARMVDELLRGFGLRTGRFTSPHLSDITERIVLDGEPVTANGQGVHDRRPVPALRQRDGEHRQADGAEVARQPERPGQHRRHRVHHAERRAVDRGHLRPDDDPANRGQRTGRPVLHRGAHGPRARQVVDLQHLPHHRAERLAGCQLLSVRGPPRSATHGGRKARKA